MATLQNQLPTIGELDELIGLGSTSEVVDDYGAVQLTLPQITPTIRAKVRYMMTNEREQEKQEKFTQEVKVFIRYNANALVANVMYWDSLYWDVYAVERTPRDRFHVLKCRQIAE